MTGSRKLAGPSLTRRRLLGSTAAGFQASLLVSVAVQAAGLVVLARWTSATPGADR